MDDSFATDVKVVRITVKLFLSLTKYQPASSCNGVFELEIMPGAKIGDLLAELNIPEELAEVILINGIPSQTKDESIQDGDIITMLPFVIGG